MISLEAIQRFVGRMALMRYFPADPAAKTALGEMLTEMVGTDEQLAWLGKRMGQLYAEWPGEHDLRAVYCSKFIPLDGVNAVSFGGKDNPYPDGIPSETPPRLEPADDPLLIGDSEMRELAKAVAERKRLV